MLYTYILEAILFVISARKLMQMSPALLKRAVGNFLWVDELAE